MKEVFATFGYLIEVGFNWGGWKKSQNLISGGVLERNVLEGIFLKMRLIQKYKGKKGTSKNIFPKINKPGKVGKKLINRGKLE